MANKGEEPSGLCHKFHIFIVTSNIVLEYFKKAIIVRTNVFGPNHIEVAHAYKNIGAAYASLERFSDAKISIQKALAIFSQNYGNQHPECKELEDIIEHFDRLMRNE